MRFYLHYNRTTRSSGGLDVTMLKKACHLHLESCFGIQSCRKRGKCPRPFIPHFLWYVNYIMNSSLFFTMFLFLKVARGIRNKMWKNGKENGDKTRFTELKSLNRQAWNKTCTKKMWKAKKYKTRTGDKPHYPVKKRKKKVLLIWSLICLHLYTKIVALWWWYFLCNII